jgi:hypothetical protein
VRRPGGWSGTLHGSLGDTSDVWWRVGEVLPAHGWGPGEMELRSPGRSGQHSEVRALTVFAKMISGLYPRNWGDAGDKIHVSCRHHWEESRSI